MLGLGDSFNIIDIFVYIFFFVMVIVGAYYSTKMISKKGVMSAKGRKINIIERVNIDKDKSFALLKICDKIYLVGISTNGMTVIDTFDEEEIMEEENGITKDNEGIKHSFEQILAKLFNRGDGDQE